jgi:hypothetical protein
MKLAIATVQWFCLLWTSTMDRTLVIDVCTSIMQKNLNQWSKLKQCRVAWPSLLKLHWEEQIALSCSRLASSCCTSFWTMPSELQPNLLVLVIHIIKQVHLWGLHSSLDLYEAWKQNVGTGISPTGIPKTSKWTVQVDDWSLTYLHH